MAENFISVHVDFYVKLRINGDDMKRKHLN